MQQLEDLALVLVQALHHDVVHRVWFQDDAVALDQCLRKVDLVRLLDLGETLTEAWVIGKWLETAQLVKIRKPTIANRFGDELRTALGSRRA